MAISFCLKRPHSNGPTCIYLRIMFEGHSVKFYTKESIHPKYWDSKKQAVRITKAVSNALDINTYLLKLKCDVDFCIRDFRILHNAFPQPNELKSILKQKFSPSCNQDQYSITKYFDHFIKLSEAGQRSEISSESTIKVYRQTLQV